MIHVMGARYRYVRCDEGIPLSRNPCRDMQHSLQVRIDESLNVHETCTSSALILRLFVSETVQVYSVHEDSQALGIALHQDES